MIGRWLESTRPSGQLAAPLLAALVALALGLLTHLPHFPWWISGLTIACAAYRWTAERRRWRLLPPIIRIVIVIGAFLVVVASFRSINGLVPGSALLAVMAGLKLLETRQVRDLHVVVMVAAFLLLAGTLRTQSLLMLPYIGVAGPALILAWVAVGRQGKALPSRTLLYHAKSIVLPAIPLVAVFFILFPRIQGSFWALPADGGARTGISDSMTPGDISNLVQSNEIAFRVEFLDAQPDAPQLYWRGPVLEYFRDRTWQRSVVNRERVSELITSGSSDSVRYRIIQQPSGQRWLFGLEYAEIERSSSIRRSTTGSLISRQRIDQILAMDIRSRPNANLREQLSGEQHEKLTGFATAGNPRAQILARELAQRSSDTQTHVASVLSWFRDGQFAYTLEPPALGRDSIDEFLFGTRRGFCAHFASAFAFLMRAADVPARVVVGYQGGEINPMTGQLIVRQSDAHAWVEVWHPDGVWRRVDPTAEVAAIRIESGLDAALEAVGERRSFFAWDIPIAERAQLLWDALNARWDEWILGYGPDTQRAFLRWLGLENPDWRTLILGLGGATLFALALIAWRINKRFAAKTKDPVEKHYRKLIDKHLERQPPGASPNMIKAALIAKYPEQAHQIRTLIDHYQAIRFAGEPDRQSFTRDLRALRRDLDQVHARATKPPPRKAA